MRKLNVVNLKSLPLLCDLNKLRLVFCERLLGDFAVQWLAYDIFSIANCRSYDFRCKRGVADACPTISPSPRPKNPLIKIRCSDLQARMLPPLAPQIPQWNSRLCCLAGATVPTIRSLLIGKKSIIDGMFENGGQQ